MAGCASPDPAYVGAVSAHLRNLLLPIEAERMLRRGWHCEAELFSSCYKCMPNRLLMLGDTSPAV